MIQNKRILVTGGAGFIGSNLANTLAADNDVVVVDNGYLGIKENLTDEIEFRKQTVLAPELPTDVDIVFHLAALPSYKTHERDNSNGCRVNVEGFVNVVEQARQNGCETVVYASTASLYETEAEMRSVTENTPINANTGYEASKLARERYAEYFANHYEMDLAGMRFLSPYQRLSGTDNHDQGYPNIVAQFVDDIAHGRSPTVYGNGRQTRDFIHVGDLSSGLITAAEGQLTGVYNLGTGRKVSFNELIDMINATLDSSVEPEYISNPTSDCVNVHNTVTDCTKLCAKTGWEPKISLEEGIKRICSEYKQVKV